jgi:hypothetical protein
MRFMSFMLFLLLLFPNPTSRQGQVEHAIGSPPTPSPYGTRDAHVFPGNAGAGPRNGPTPAIVDQRAGVSGAPQTPGGVSSTRRTTSGISVPEESAAGARTTGCAGHHQPLGEPKVDNVEPMRRV